MDSTSNGNNSSNDDQLTRTGQIKKKVPICNIDPSHIAALKKMFKVKLP